MLRAVHFHDEPRRRSKEVHDEALQDNLAAKPHAELAAAQRLPKHPLRLRRRLAHAVRVRRKLDLPLKLPAPPSVGVAARPVRARLRLRAGGGPHTPGIRPDVRVPQG